VSDGIYNIIYRLNWFRLKSKCGLSWIWQWHSVFHKRREIFRTTVNFQERFCTTDLSYDYFQFNLKAVIVDGRFQWPRILRRKSVASRLLRLWAGIPPGAWKSVCCKCCVLWGRDLCDELIIRPEESYRVWCVWVWSRNLVNDEVMAHWGTVVPKTK
jgi:hypothetical protein